MTPTLAPQPRPDGEILHEVTRSICPECRAVIDAQVLLRDDKVYMRKRCEDHGWFEGLIYADAKAYVEQARFNKPGQAPARISTEVLKGCPLDCGICPEHRQHTCLALIEVNSACNLDCPVCFANAGAGFNLTLPEVEGMLDRFVELEGHPEVVQFSGGEPTIHPDLLEMIEAAQARDISYVMVNTNGLRIANDPEWFAKFAALRPLIYLQFDGLTDATYEVIRGEPLLDTKLRALEHLAEADLHVVLVAAIERNVNEHEAGAIVEFGLKHPAVRGVMFQPVTHSGRHPDHDPLQRMTIPDVMRALDAHPDGTFRSSDFVPIPCCFPTCSSVTYAYLGDEGEVIPLPRILEVDQYLDYITNRSVPGIDRDVLHALEGLWSAGSVPGDTQADAFVCAACDLDLPALTDLSRRIFMVQMRDFLDPWTFDVKKAMKCCIGILQDDGRMIPFCTYNTVGYREETRQRLAARNRRGTPVPVLDGVGAPLR
ncbi:MAG: radical SAM protein [Chloroflexi bacterium]|nr:radical SAM protein [Chloroflexota bacterium]